MRPLDDRTAAMVDRRKGPISGGIQAFRLRRGLELAVKPRQIEIEIEEFSSQDKRGGKRKIPLYMLLNAYSEYEKG